MPSPILYSLKTTVFLLASISAFAHASLAGPTPQPSGLPDFSQIPDLKNPKPELPALAEPGEVYVIFAHADDELDVLGQIAEYRRHHPLLTIHWLMVTDNQSGMIQAGACLPGQSPSDCRALEADHAADCVGIEHPKRLGLLDGGLNQIPLLKLKRQIWTEIRSLKRAPVVAFFSSDEMGVYGHPDHLAVHDAVLALSREQHIPLVSLAVPPQIQPLIPVRPNLPPIVDGGVSRPRAFQPVTNSLSLDPQEKPGIRDALICADAGYKSQADTIASFRGGLNAQQFYTAIPREFFNLSGE